MTAHSVNDAREEALRRERDEARAERDLAKALHDVAVQQRDAREHALRVAERERDEARAQLADIRRLWDAVVDAAIDALPDGGGLVSGVAEAARQLGVMRRVRAEALREAADRLSAQPVAAGLLREWADEIEGGR